MVQWVNLHRIEKFVNPKRLYTTYGRSGGLHLAEPGLMAGRQSGRQSDEIWARYVWHFKSLIAVDQNIRFSVLFNKRTALFKHF